MATPLVENFQELSQDELLEVRLEDCNLKGRALKVLTDPHAYAHENDSILRKRWYEGHPELFIEFETVGDLVDTNSHQILNRPGCGRKTLNEIRDGLRAMGLFFRNEVR